MGRLSAAAGSVRPAGGSGLPGSRIGSLSAASFGRCVGAGGPLSTLQAGGLPWYVNFSSYGAARGVA
jgi:hypothetical protein